MKITKITRQVKRADRYSVFVDSKYSFSLSDSALLEQKLIPGQELEVAEVKRLKQLSSDDKLYGNALRYAAMRPRSQWEISDYLKRKSVPPLLAKQITNKLQEFGYIDDQKFAESWIANRRLLRPTSKRKLQQELRAKRVSDEVIQQVLAGDETDELAVLKQIIAKKRSKYPDQQKLMQYLARQGFSYSDIKTALEVLD